jgi:hypothetical protein
MRRRRARAAGVDDERQRVHAADARAVPPPQDVALAGVCFVCACVCVCALCVRVCVYVWVGVGVCVCGWASRQIVGQRPRTASRRRQTRRNLPACCAALGVSGAPGERAPAPATHGPHARTGPGRQRPAGPLELLWRRSNARLAAAAGRGRRLHAGARACVWCLRCVWRGVAGAARATRQRSRRQWMLP